MKITFYIFTLLTIMIVLLWNRYEYYSIDSYSTLISNINSYIGCQHHEVYSVLDLKPSTIDVFVVNTKTHLSFVYHVIYDNNTMKIKSVTKTRVDPMDTLHMYKYHDLLIKI